MRWGTQGALSGLRAGCRPTRPLLTNHGPPTSSSFLKMWVADLDPCPTSTWVRASHFPSSNLGKGGLLESRKLRTTFFLLHIRPKHHLEFRLCSFTAADTYALSHRQSRATSLSGVDLTLPSLKQRFFATRSTRLVRSSSLRPFLSPSCHIAGYLSI
jgi:hypothetical protein